MTDAPSPRQERLLLAAFARLTSRGEDGGAGAAERAPPAAWGSQPFGIVRAEGGVLAALHYPHEDARGVVIFGHTRKSFFHDGDRIPYVRGLGFAAMSFDHGGQGESDAAATLHHREWIDALSWARRRYPNLPVHVWAVGLGGYFAHHALASDEKGIASAIFEDVPTQPLSRGAHAARALMIAPHARRWLAAERHAPRLAAEHVLYVSGARDPDATRTARLAEAAGPFARHHVVAEAGHREAWTRGGDALRDAVERTLTGA